MLSAVRCRRAVCGAGQCPASRPKIASGACARPRPRNPDGVAPRGAADAGPSAPPRERHAPAEGTAASEHFISVLIAIFQLPVINARRALMPHRLGATSCAKFSTSFGSTHTIYSSRPGAQGRQIAGGTAGAKGRNKMRQATMQRAVRGCGHARPRCHTSPPPCVLRTSLRAVCLFGK